MAKNAEFVIRDVLIFFVQYQVIMMDMHLFSFDCHGTHQVHPCCKCCDNNDI